MATRDWYRIGHRAETNSLFQGMVGINVMNKSMTCQNVVIVAFCLWMLLRAVFLMAYAIAVCA